MTRIISTSSLNAFHRFLYTILGWSALVGVATMIVLLPIPAWVSKIMNGAQREKMKATDRRVQYIKEVLTILRMLKMFGYEKLVSRMYFVEFVTVSLTVFQVKQQIDAKREEELFWVLRRGLLALVNTVSNYTIPLIHMIVTFLLYTTVQKQRLSASIVFSALTGFNMLRMGINAFVYQLPTLIQANVAMGRVQEFLNDAELLDQYTADAVIQDASTQHVDDLGLAQASFFWSKEHSTNGALTPSRQKFRLRIEDDVIFTPGKINLIVGPTGSGKTSLLMALLGEMHYVPSGPGAWVNIPRKGGVAYCAQEAWIQSMSIRDNILFGTPYDEVRYKKGKSIW
jgi:ABC-type multidrug transport system fused ATPase/permease subunit